MMTVTQPKRRRPLLVSSAKLPLLTAREKKEKVLEMIDAVALMDLLEEVNRAIAVLSEAMKSACHIYYTDYGDLEELQVAGTGEHVPESVTSLLCYH